MSKQGPSLEVTEEQRRKAEEWEKQMKKEQEKERAMASKQELMQQEAIALAQFLINLNPRMKRTQLIVDKPDGKKQAVNCEYILGKDLHAAIILHREQILKLVPTINSFRDLNGLQSITDSCQVVMAMIRFGAMNRIMPHMQTYPNPSDPAAKRPKACQMFPQEHMTVQPVGFYIFQIQVNKQKTQFWLIAVVALAFFFLLFRVWPEWLKIGMWYVSWYTLVFLVVTAIVRAIIWFIIFHVGIDFWIFPNYFIDSNNPLDSFWPLLEVGVREDIFDFRMLILRIASVLAIAYGAQEFFKEPENFDQLLTGGGELWDEMYDWGQHKFMGTVDPNQQIEVKKSARQIYAEAFMDDENPMFRTNTHFAEYADEDAVKEASQRFAEQRKFTDDGEDEDEVDEEVTLEAKEGGSVEEEGAAEPEEDAASLDDLLDSLTGNVDEEEEEEAQ